MLPTKRLAEPLILVAASLLIDSAAFGRTIYSVPFDYRKATPSSVYFSGKSSADIDHLCNTGEHASTADIAACSKRNYEQSAAHLEVAVRSLASRYKQHDIDLKKTDNAVASPYFEKAQNAWKKFRDHQCYAETYSSGEASMRYVTFWDCMTRLTKNRFDELTRANADE